MDRQQIKKRLTFWYALLWILLFCALFLSYGVYFLDLSSTKSKWIGLFAGAISILVASLKVLELNFYSIKNTLFERMSKYFTSGSFVFIKKLFKIVFVLVLLIAALLFKPMGREFTICFVCGSFFAFLAIIASTLVASKIALQLPFYNGESKPFVLRQIFNSGASISFFTLGFAIIPLVILYHITKDYQTLNGFALGCALVVLISNVSLSASRQALDSANNAVCEFVAQIEQNDKRNPLLLFGGITKNIFSCVSSPCDLFVSFVAVLVCAMTIGGETLLLMGAFLPLIIAASAIFSCIVPSLFINKFSNFQNPSKMLFVSMFISVILFSVISFFLIKTWLPDYLSLGAVVALGAFGGYAICFVNANHIFSKYKPVANVSNCAISGFEPTFLQIIRESFGALIFPAFAFGAIIILSFLISGGVNEPSLGIYAILLSILSFLSCVGILIGIATFAMILKNKNNILDFWCENIEQDETDSPNLWGVMSFCLCALGENFLNSITVLTVLASIIAYSSLSGLLEADILNPYVMSALVLGAAVPFLYCAFIMGVVSKTARRLVLEVKRQFKKFPQILRFEMSPDYEKPIDISVVNSSIQIIINTIVIVLIFALVAVFLKKEALLGFVFGALISSFVLIFTINSSSNLALGAKKYFEERFNCAKNTPEYDSISLSARVFSKFKDTANTLLNALIKFLALLALALVPLFM